jgi:hypothetical protein
MTFSQYRIARTMGTLSFHSGEVRPLVFGAADGLAAPISRRHFDESFFGRRGLFPAQPCIPRRFRVNTLHRIQPSLLATLAACTFMVNIAVAQAPKVAPHPATAKPATTVAASPNITETSALQHVGPTKGPIVVEWRFKNNAGNANLTVNADGTYVFSGQYNEKKPNKDFDISLALKSTTDAILLFDYVGDAGNGVRWSKQGQSKFLSDDFSTFAGRHDWFGEYHLSETSEGRRLAYEAMEKRKEQVRREEEDALKKKDAKIAAEKKAERQQLLRQQIAQQQQAAQQSHSSGSSGFVSTLDDVIGGVTNVANTVGSAINAIGSIFSF